MHCALVGSRLMRPNVAMAQPRGGCRIPAIPGRSSRRFRGWRDRKLRLLRARLPLSAQLGFSLRSGKMAPRSTTGDLMSEAAAIIDALKRNLKRRGITYRDVARKVGLSEASVKRVFASRTFTLQRLEAICAAVGLSVGELIRSVAAPQDPHSHYLSIEQEELLASDRRLLACFYLLLNGHGSPQI